MPELKEVALKELTGEGIYRLSYFRPLDALKISLKKFGQTSPLFVLAQKNKQILFSGYLRKQAMEELGWSKAWAILWKESELGPKQAFCRTFFENALGRGLNLIEQAKAIKSLFYFGTSFGEILKDFFRPLGLNLPVSELERVPALLELGEDWQRYLVEKKSDWKTASLILDFSSSEQNDLRIFLELNPTLSQLRNILRWLGEIKRRDASGVGEILSRIKAKEVFEDKKLAGKEKLEQILKRLYQLRYPDYTRLLSRHNELCSRLKIPPQVKLEPSDYFETPEYELSIKITPASPIKQNLESLLKAVEHPLWKKLFEFNDDED